MARLLLLLLLASALVPAWAPAGSGAPVVGSEFQINSHTTERQFAPVVSSDQEGKFVVVWQSFGQTDIGYGIAGQRFDARGSPLGGEFQIHTGIRAQEFDPEVAASASGEFLVVWSDDVSLPWISGQRFDSQGTPQGREFRINEPSTYHPLHPTVTADGTGNFAVAWNGRRNTIPRSAILGRRVSSTGVPLDAEFQINTHTGGGGPRSPAVSGGGDGSFVAVWESNGQDGSSSGVSGQRYDSKGVAVGEEFQVNSHTTGAQMDPAVAVNGSGAYVVVWSSHQLDGQSDVFGQRYDSEGDPLGGEFQVNTVTAGIQSEPNVAVDTSGHFLVVWTSADQDGSYGGVFGQQFDSHGSPLGSEFQVNTFTTNDQYGPSVSTDRAGAFVVVWTSYYQDGDYSGVFGQRYAGWRRSEEYPGYRFRTLITSPSGKTIEGRVEQDCLAEVVCVSGAVPGRSEVFIRVVGPKPNGYLWPTIVKFSTSSVQVWIEQESTGVVKHYRLDGASPGNDLLPGRFDRNGFIPEGETVELTPISMSESLPPPSDIWITTSDLPDYRFQVRIKNPQGELPPVRPEALCIDETLCVSGAIPGRSEVFLRVVGPKPNGYMWPTMVKFTTSQVEVWIEQISTGEQKNYVMEAATPGSDDLTGLFDRTGFLP